MKSVTKDTFLIGRVNSLSHFLFTVGITLHVRKNTGLVSPQVVIRAKEKNRELSDIMSHAYDILGNVFGIANLCWPPSIKTVEQKLLCKMIAKARN